MRINKRSFFPGFICLIPFAVLFVLTKLFFQELYLLEWMMRHWYLGLWAISVIVALFDPKWGYVISYSNFISVIIGQVVGDYIKNQNISKVTPKMTNEQIAHLYHNPGFRIWLLAFSLIVVIYAVAYKIKRRSSIEK